MVRFQHGGTFLGRHGRVVQVDPITPALKALGTHLLILECDEPLSTFAFKINMRRYTMAAVYPPLHRHAQRTAEVGRCRLTLSTPR